jgi:hypothetical protein
MTRLALLIVVIACLCVGCDEDPGEVVSRPTTPQGDIDLNPAEEATFRTGGAASSGGHPVEYRFDLDADAMNRYTPWSRVDTVSASWPDTARYVVKAQARCASHTNVLSEWSAGHVLGVGVEIVSTPDVRVARSAPWPALPDSFCTGGATSSKGHPVEYQFEFSDGAISPWDTLKCMPHTWSVSGDQTVFVRARCVIHPDAVSDPAGELMIPLTPPEIRFATHIDGVSKPYPPGGLPVPADTVGMFRPFAISYHGVSPHGPIAGYEFARGAFSGPPTWNRDIGDTLRSFSNTGTEAFPSGIARFLGRCIDEANAQSQVATAEVVVNFDPDTRFVAVWNNYKVGNTVFTRDIDFADGIPDTVPYKSWLTIFYAGNDDPRDSLLCEPPPINPDRCIDFQVAYERASARVPGSSARSGWLPRVGSHDTDAFSATDSNTANIGSLEYDFFARSIDENGRPDGTAPQIHIVGNFDPVLDSLVVEDHFGTGVGLEGGAVDTLRWNFWKGTSAGINPVSGLPRNGWPYQSITDTVDFGDPELPYIKRYSFRIRARGHDHPREPDGSGVKSWRYMVYSDYGRPTQQFWPLAGAGESWRNGVSIDILDDKVEVTFRYPGLAHPQLPPDPNGDTVFANLPGYFNKDLTIVIKGRDTAVDEPNFSQYVYLNGVRTLVNQFPSASLGRWTEERVATFHLQFKR